MNLWEQWGWRWRQWHKGERGEYWFLAQVIGLIGFGLLPIRPLIGGAEIAPGLHLSQMLAAGGLGVVALVFLGKGLMDLGQSLTPLPYPREDGILVTTGVYGLVRHPLYAGILLGALAWGLWTLSWPHLLGLLVLITILDQKSRREEQWLLAKYPDYQAYQQRVKKFIPQIW